MAPPGAAVWAQTARGSPTSSRTATSQIRLGSSPIFTRTISNSGSARRSAAPGTGRGLVVVALALDLAILRGRCGGFGAPSVVAGGAARLDEFRKGQHLFQIARTERLAELAPL